MIGLDECSSNSSDVRQVEHYRPITDLPFVVCENQISPKAGGMCSECRPHPENNAECLYYPKKRRVIKFMDIRRFFFEHGSGSEEIPIYILCFVEGAERSQVLRDHDAAFEKAKDSPWQYRHQDDKHHKIRRLYDLFLPPKPNKYADRGS